jgi:hypothetical protein
MAWKFDRVATDQDLLIEHRAVQILTSTPPWPLAFEIVIIVTG